MLPGSGTSGTPVTGTGRDVVDLVDGELIVVGLSRVGEGWMVQVVAHPEDHPAAHRTELAVDAVDTATGVGAEWGPVGIVAGDAVMDVVEAFGASRRHRPWVTEGRNERHSAGVSGTTEADSAPREVTGVRRIFREDAAPQFEGMEGCVSTSRRSGSCSGPREDARRRTRLPGPTRSAR